MANNGFLYRVILGMLGYAAASWYTDGRMLHQWTAKWDYLYLATVLPVDYGLMLHPFPFHYTPPIVV
jgi:hypothetical protein